MSEEIEKLVIKMATVGAARLIAGFPVEEMFDAPISQEAKQEIERLLEARNVTI